MANGGMDYIVQQSKYKLDHHITTFGWASMVSTLSHGSTQDSAVAPRSLLERITKVYLDKAWRYAMRASWARESWIRYIIIMCSYM